MHIKKMVPLVQDISEQLRRYNLEIHKNGECMQEVGKKYSGKSEKKTGCSMPVKQKNVTFVRNEARNGPAKIQPEGNLLSLVVFLCHQLISSGQKNISAQVNKAGGQ